MSEEDQQKNAAGDQQDRSTVDSTIDKAQEYRGGEGEPDSVDKAVNKAQETGMTDKIVNKLKSMFGGGS